MTTRQNVDPLLSISPDVAWDVRLLCFVGALICVLLAADLALRAVRALVQAVSAAVMGALAAGTALGLLAAAAITLL
jgi:hypothetical protein